MKCSEARETLTHDYPSPLRPTDREAQEHVQTCPKCQAHFRVVRRLRTRLSELEAEKPSAEFKERLLAAVAQARLKRALNSRAHKLKVPFALASIALFLLIGWVWLRPRFSETRLPDYLVSDHQEILPDRLMVASSSPADIERWFDGKVDFPVRVRALSGAHVQGARLCEVFGRRAALVFYQSDSHTISWFTFPAMRDGPKTKRLYTVRGYSVYVWNDTGLTNALVSDLDGTALANMLGLEG